MMFACLTSNTYVPCHSLSCHSCSPQRQRAEAVTRWPAARTADPRGDCKASGQPQGPRRHNALTPRHDRPACHAACPWLCTQRRAIHVRHWHAWCESGSWPAADAAPRRVYHDPWGLSTCWCCGVPGLDGTSCSGCWHAGGPVGACDGHTLPPTDTVAVTWGSELRRRCWTVGWDTRGGGCSCCCCCPVEPNDWRSQ